MYGRALAPLPVIGNGDILSRRDHEERLEQAEQLEQQKNHKGTDTVDNLHY